MIGQDIERKPEKLKNSKKVIKRNQIYAKFHLKRLLRFLFRLRRKIATTKLKVANLKILF